MVSGFGNRSWIGSGKWHEHILRETPDVQSELSRLEVRLGLNPKYLSEIFVSGVPVIVTVSPQIFSWETRP
jgi:hypothetical protein